MRRRRVVKRRRGVRRRRGERRRGVRWWSRGVRRRWTGVNVLSKRQI